MSARPPGAGDGFGLRPPISDDLRGGLARWPREGWAGAATSSPVVDLWLARHRLFRDLLVALDPVMDGIEARSADPSASRARFGRLARLLLGELDTHHHVEDAHYFPVFREVAPELVRGFDVMDRDHEALDAEIAGFGAEGGALLAALGDRRADPRPALDALRARRRRFDAALLRHLDDEEDLVIPLILDRADDPRLR